MERRTVLATIGIGLTTTVAGCLTQARPADDPGANTDDESSDPDDGDQGDVTTDRTVIDASDAGERSIGDDSLLERGLRKPHLVVLGNRTSETWESELTITRSGEIAFDESFELAPEASVRVSVTDLDEYVVRAAVADTEEVETVDIGLEQFDCNGTTVSMEIVDDGSLASSTMSTLVACEGIVTKQIPTGESESYTIVTDENDDEPAAETHAVVLDNPTDETWSVRLLLDEDSRPIFDGVYVLEPAATVELVLDESGDYTLESIVLETGKTEREPIGPDYFDCNASSTQVTLDSEGGMEIASISTLMACDLEPDHE